MILLAGIGIIGLLYGMIRTSYRVKKEQDKIKKLLREHPKNMQK